MGCLIIKSNCQEELADLDGVDVVIMDVGDLGGAVVCREDFREGIFLG